MFTYVYSSLRFDPTKATEMMKNYPTLESRQLEVLYEAVLVMGSMPSNQYLKWTNLVTESCRTLPRSSWALAKILRGRLGHAQVDNIRVASPWQQTSMSAEGNGIRVEGGSDTSAFQFSGQIYTAEEIKEMKSLCESTFHYPVEYKPATEVEIKIAMRLVHGNIVCSQLPQFIKRILDSDERARLRNTMKAQVEGELVIHLTTDDQIYAFNQTTNRLLGMITVTAGTRMGGNPRLAEMIKSVKTASYNPDEHAVHLYFKTRELECEKPARR